MAPEWTPERIKLLTDLWNEGLATGEIGRRLGFTKNAVIGKAHRLGLAKRQSPIQRDGAAGGTSKKPAREAPAARKSPPAKSSAPADAAPKQPPAPARPKRPAQTEVVTLDRLSHGMCCWPIGEPGTPEFRFCGEEALPGKPYCAFHCEVAYVRSSKTDKHKDKAADKAA